MVPFHASGNGGIAGAVSFAAISLKTRLGYDDSLDVVGVHMVGGIVGGALPGITNTMTVIMVLPFTFGLEPLQGLAAMIGVYVGGESGGLITSTLLGIPGHGRTLADRSVAADVDLRAILDS